MALVTVGYDYSRTSANGHLLVSYCAVSCVLYTRVLFYITSFGKGTLSNTLFQNQLQSKQQTSFWVLTPPSGIEYVFPSGDFGRCILAGSDSLLAIAMATLAPSTPPNM